MTKKNDLTLTDVWWSSVFKFEWFYSVAQRINPLFSCLTSSTAKEKEKFYSRCKIKKKMKRTKYRHQPNFNSLWRKEIQIVTYEWFLYFRRHDFCIQIRVLPSRRFKFPLKSLFEYVWKNKRWESQKYYISELERRIWVQGSCSKLLPPVRFKYVRD